MKIRQLLVGGGTAAVLASTALVGITAGTAHAAGLTCTEMENARAASVDAYNGAYDSWQYYLLRGDVSSTSYYYNMSEFWQGRVDYFTRNLQAC